MLVLFGLALCIFWFSSILASAAYVLHKKYVPNISGNPQYKWLIWHVLAAACVSFTVTIWFALPTSVQAGLTIEHCHNTHCGDHLPLIAKASLMDLLYAFFLISMVVLVALLLKFSKRKLDEQANTLLQLSNAETYTSDKSSVNVIRSDRSLLLNVGMLKPRLIVSSHMLESLDNKAIKTLLAFELSKGLQHEILKVKLASMLCSLWPRRVRLLLICDLRNLINGRAHRQTLTNTGITAVDVESCRHIDVPENVRKPIADAASKDYDSTSPNRASKHAVYSFFIAIFACIAYFLCLFVLVYNAMHILLEALELAFL